MARASKYKWQAGDEVGLYRVIKVLPKQPHVKNLVIYAECLLCKEKVERWSNRMDSKHRGCTAPAVIDKEPEPAPVAVVHVKPHTRANGSIVETGEDGKPIEVDVSADDPEELDLGDMNLPPEILTALNFDVDAHAVELVKKAEELDSGTKFLFITTLRRYLTLVHVGRKIERKLASMEDMTIAGSNGNQVANPLLTQYKAISSESNVTVRVLNGIVAKFKAKDAEDDPLVKALNGGR